MQHEHESPSALLRASVQYDVIYVYIYMYKIVYIIVFTQAGRENRAPLRQYRADK